METDEKSSSILKCSKSESNLYSFNGASNNSSSLNVATSMQVVNSRCEKMDEMVTSTPAPNVVVSDHNFQTPRRGTIISRSSGSSSNSRRFVRTSSEISSRTPSSGPRLNPFDSHLSVDRLHLPTCSPSVFSIVVSPSQEETSSKSGKFWSLDQQARLFPAQISDDSPWKQEAAVSRLTDQATEDKTQEAIDLYFSQNHQVTTPEDVPLMTVSSLQQRSVLMDSVGTSPPLMNSQHNDSKGEDVSGCSSIAYDQGQACKTTQTWLSFPAILPPDLESVLEKYGLLETAPPAEGVKTIAPSIIAWGKRNNDGNISNSTLRRKLFAGIGDDDMADETDDEDELEIKIAAKKENCESTAMIISPGKVMMTPNAQRIPSPNKSVRKQPRIFSKFPPSFDFCSISVIVVAQPCFEEKEAQHSKYSPWIVHAISSLILISQCVFLTETFRQ